MSLETGDKAPDFSLIADNGKPYKLSSKTKSKMMLVFYPGDGLPICEKQFLDYKEEADAFKKQGVEVVGISGNDIKAIKAFKKEHDLPFVMLSDEKGEVAEQYNAFGWFGVKRAVYLLDKNLEILYRHIEPVSIYARTSEELHDVIERKS
jgi:peroxiredoxin Q/BCP